MILSKCLDVERTLMYNRLYCYKHIVSILSAHGNIIGTGITCKKIPLLYARLSFHVAYC